MTDIALPDTSAGTRLATKDDFNLDDYDTVASRVKQFWKTYPEGRQATEILSATGDVGATRWVVRASLWTHRWEDRDMTIKRVEPDAQGIAVEVDGGEGVNEFSALENAETSALGRALANLGFSGDKRASREEMRKPQRQRSRRRTGAPKPGITGGPADSKG
jgi:hypothetical protein